MARRADVFFFMTIMDSTMDTATIDGGFCFDETIDYPFVNTSLAPAASAGSICTAPETGERVNRIP